MGQPGGQVARQPGSQAARPPGSQASRPSRPAGQAFSSGSWYAAALLFGGLGRRARCLREQLLYDSILYYIILYYMLSYYMILCILYYITLRYGSAAPSRSGLASRTRPRLPAVFACFRPLPSFSFPCSIRGCFATRRRRGPLVCPASPCPLYKQNLPTIVLGIVLPRCPLYNKACRIASCPRACSREFRHDREAEIGCLAAPSPARQSAHTVRVAYAARGIRSRLNVPVMLTVALRHA